ncbi:MAG: response regulator [Pseudomonadales bacterium]
MSIILVLMLAAALVAVPAALSSEERLVYDRLTSANNLKALWLQREFDELRTTLNSLSTNVALLDDIRFVNTSLPRLPAAPELFARIRSGDKGEDPVAGDRLSLYWQSFSRIHPYFRYVEHSDRGSEIYLVRPADQLVIYSFHGKDALMKLLPSVGLGAAVDRCYQGALASPDSVVIEDFMMTEAGPRACAAVAMVLEGKPVGVLIEVFSPQIINDIMALRPGLGSTGETYLVGVDKLMRTESRFWGAQSLLTRFVDNRAVREGLAGYGGKSLVKDYRGENVFAVWQPVQVDSIRWSLIATMEEKEAFAGMRSNMSQLLLAWWLGFLVLLVVAYVFARRTERPLLALLNNARRLARGNYAGAITDQPGSREISDLVANFNSMAAQIRERTEALDASRQRAEYASLEAERANRAKSDFLSRMSHELRTPLNGVLGYAQLLRRDDNLASSQRETLSAIENCGQHLLELINDVLDLARIESGQMDVECRPYDLNNLLSRVRDVVQPRAMQKGVEFKVINSGVPVAINTDAMKLRQILINLLGNAIKFTDRGSVTLRVEKIQNTQRLRFSVVDTGVGIPEDKIEEVFSPFAQTSVGKQAGGTGLGLAITQQLCHALGGSLWLESKVGVGSCFYFDMPYTLAKDWDAAAEGQPRTPPLLEPQKDITVLVADDNPTNRDILVQLLQSAGIKTREASNGEQVLALLQQYKTDLVLMDIRMPVMDGLQATSALRADPDFETLPIIAISATVQAELEAQINQAGCNAFISKPVDSHRLFTEIASLLNLDFHSGQIGGDLARRLPEEETRLSGQGLQQWQACLQEIHEYASLGDVAAIRSSMDNVLLLLGEDDPRVLSIRQFIDQFAMDELAEYCSQQVQKISEEIGRG